MKYPYYGMLEEIDFLARLYNLDEMESLDSRYLNARDDIWHHTVNNDDYPFCWVFEDERFSLKVGSDEIYLRFMCEIFHPAVRIEQGDWREFLSEVNRLLRNDGYELYVSEKISNRDIYSWRKFQLKQNNIFVPYSQRNIQKVKEIQQNHLEIGKEIRHQIKQAFSKYDEVHYTTNETGWNEQTLTSELVIDDLQQFYPLQFMNEQHKQVKVDTLDELIHIAPLLNVLDAIESFEKNTNKKEFRDQINAIFELNNLGLNLENGEVENNFGEQIKNEHIIFSDDLGVQELLEDAVKFYNEANMKIAVQQLWHAFERLKTYYSPDLDKKASVKKIISHMCNGESAYKNLFEDEFRALTKMGNDFRIRHHEKNRINIDDTRHYEYFYKRCLALINTALLYLEDKVPM